MILLIVVSTVSVVLLWYTPFVERSKSETQTSAIYQQFTSLDEIIERVTYQGVNATSKTEMTMEQGSITVSDLGERIVIWYSLLDQNYDFYVRGLDDGDNRLQISEDGGVGDCYLDVLWLDGTDRNVITANGDINAWRDFDVTNNIEDAVRINIYKDSDDSLIGRIFVFDTGTVEYNLDSQFGPYKTAVENNAIILNLNPGGTYNLIKSPVVFDDDEDLSLKIIQIKPTDTDTIAGVNTNFRFTVRCDENKILASQNETFNLKMQIYNNEGVTEDEAAWFRFFSTKNDFEEETSQINDGNTLIKPPPSNTKFTLVHSVCSVSMEVLL